MSSGEIPVNNSGEIPANSLRACSKTGYPQKATSPLGNKREAILCLTCASLRLALSLACVWDFARLVFFPFRLLLANFEINQQWQSRHLLVSFFVWLVSSLETVGPVPGALNCWRAFWGWCTAVFCAKILPVYVFNLIWISFPRGELIKHTGNPQEVQPEGS